MQSTFDLIDNIETERKKLRIPVFELCQESGFDGSTYQRWRNRETSPQGRNLDSLLKAFEKLRKKYIRRVR